jgi:hypothetical protein
MVYRSHVEIKAENLTDAMKFIKKVSDENVEREIKLSYIFEIEDNNTGISANNVVPFPFTRRL